MSEAFAQLRERFQAPDPDDRPLALWLWNGELHEAQISRQIRELAAKGMGGVVIRASRGLRTPYLGDRWWEIIEYAVRAATKAGLSVWIGDDYRAPSGPAGDPGEADGQTASQVLTSGPEHHGKALARTVLPVEGPAEVSLEGRYPEGEPLVRVAGRVDGTQGLDPESLTEIPEAPTWACPEGNWQIFSFAVRQLDDHIDYLRPATVARFVEAAYMPYAERLGDAIAGFAFDAPHLASQPIPWTEDLPAQFAARKGYALLPLLPQLIVRGGDTTAKLRCDFYEVLGELYTESWFEQIAAWCEERGYTWMGHTEEHIAAQPARQGDYFRTMRAVPLPGSDMHGFRNARPREVQPAEIKPAVSIAALAERPRVAVRAFGGAGWGVSLDDVRRGLSRLAVIGADLPVIQSFFYSMDRAVAADDWPNTFFAQNPYWRQFGEVTSYAARLSALVRQSRATTSIGVLAPLASVRANTADGRPNARAREVGESFESLVDGLYARRVDVHIVDSEFLLESELDGASLREGRVAINALVIPPTPVMEHAVAARISDFVKAGGRLVWSGEFPSASSEIGSDDEDLMRTVKPLTPAGASTKRGSRLGKGRIFTLKEAADDWLDRVAARLAPATSLTSDLDGIALAARRLDGGEVVLVVNETPDEQKVGVKTRAKGPAELWDPETGQQEALSTSGARTRRTAEFLIPGHSARAVVFDATTRPARAASSRRASRAKPKDLGCEWQFALETGVPTGQGTVRRTELPVMRFQDFALGAGRLERLRDPAFDDSAWRELWLTTADASAVGNWRASWITGLRQPEGWVVRPDSEAHDRLRFTKSLTITDPPIKAWATFVGVERATVYMNGTALGESDDWSNPVTYNIMPYLRLGQNTIVADVTSTSATPLSLLFEAQIDLRSGESLVLVSDSSWDVQAPQSEMWTGTAFARDVPTVTWERGRPPVQPWGHIVLLGEPVRFPRTLMYRQRLPLGCVGIGIPYIKGVHKVYVDVRERTPDINGIYNITTGGVLSVEVNATDFSNGVLAPLTLLMRPTTIALAPWHELGYAWYSGSAVYEKSVELTKVEASGTVMLDLGDVRHHAEVIVNNRSLGSRLWPPYRFDLTGAVHSGSNTVRVRVSNLAANEMRWRRDEARMGDPWHRYWHEDNIEPERLVSGLLGPVQVQLSP
jgi:hypothetical protein